RRRRGRRGVAGRAPGGRRAAMAGRRPRRAAAVAGHRGVHAARRAGGVGPFLVARSAARRPPGAGPPRPPAGPAVFPTPMLEPSLFGALAMVGTGWMLLTARRDERARALLVTAACGYLWYALSTLALLRHTTLLAFRVEVPLNAVFAAAGVLGLV